MVEAAMKALAMCPACTLSLLDWLIACLITYTLIYSCTYLLTLYTPILWRQWIIVMAYLYRTLISQDIPLCYCRRIYVSISWFGEMLNLMDSVEDASGIQTLVCHKSCTWGNNKKKNDKKRRRHLCCTSCLCFYSKVGSSVWLRW